MVLTTGDDDHRLELLARLGLSLGVVTLLERPLRQARLVAAMRVALNARRRQYEVRALLEEREQREQVLRERAAKLRASEAQFRETADAAPAMLWVSDATLAWTYLSRSWYEYTGTKRGSGLGKGWAKQIHSSDRDRVLQAFADAARSGKPIQVEYRLRVSYGSYRWTLDMSHPQFGPNGALADYVGSVIDIEDLRVAERETQRHRALLDAVLDSLPVGIVIADPEGRLVRWNKAHEELWGFGGSAAPPSTASIPDYAQWRGWWPETGERIQPEEWTLSQALLERQAVTGQLMEIERFDGRGRRFLMNASAPVFDAAGELIAAVAAQTDVTEQRQTQETLRDADRRKDEFLATLALELRNPLAPIRTAVELLKLNGPQDDMVISCRDMIDRQVTDLTRLVDDLLEVSRITRGKLELRKDLVQLRQVVERAVEAARPLIDASHHVLEVSMPEGERWLLADATRLAQVFTNLLNNASRYTATGGRISLNAAAENGELRMTVRDTGIGIAAEHLPGIFEMFSQVTPALERSGSGLGVGLALAKALVDLHGGSIVAHSAGVGHGSEFEVRLPEVDGPSMAAVAANGVGEGATPLRILVVDDNRDSADGLAMLLGLMGHEVTVAYDALDALQLMEQARPQVVLLDIGLPTMNGYQVARQIRAEPWGGDVILIAQTGWGQQEDKRRAADAGFDHHMTKPLNIATISTLLTRIAAG